MFTNFPPKGKTALIAMTCLWASLLASPAVADEKTVEEYIETAQPYLHLSCEDAWELTGADEDEYINIIHHLVAITFINFDFDVELIQQAPKADQEKLSKAFYDEVGRRCRERPQLLLAGVVDGSLVYAFGEVVSETNDSPE